MTARSTSARAAVALTAILGAVAPSAASAGSGASGSKGGYGPSPPPTIQIVRTSEHGGFEWGDAGIGAAGGVGLSMLLLGGSFVITGGQRRERVPIAGVQGTLAPNTTRISGPDG